MGASALLGGSTRMTISLTAIIMEITNDIYYLLPIMLVVMVSKWVGDRFNPAIYESHVALNEIPYLEHSLPKWIPSYLCAKDIMTRNVMCLPVICPLRILNRYLRDKTKIHNAFPIIDCEPNKSIQENYTKKDGKFVGVMLRWHIMIILSKRNFAVMDKLPELKLLTLNDLTDSEYKNKYISSYQKDFGISLHELNHCYVDFSPYMHLSPFTVQIYTPIYRVYTLFRGLGLRHLIVLDSNNKFVAGIITAQNLSESALEHAVNSLNTKINNNEITNNDYVCHRLQQMNQSKAIKKYQLSKRFISVDTFLYNNNNKSVPLPETLENEISTTRLERSVSYQVFSIAKDEKDTINVENRDIPFQYQQDAGNILIENDNDNDNDDDDKQQDEDMKIAPDEIENNDLGNNELGNKQIDATSINDDEIIDDNLEDNDDDDEDDTTENTNNEGGDPNININDNSDSNKQQNIDQHDEQSDNDEVNV